MANSDKNIIITPYVSGVTQPQMTFVGQGNDPIYLKVLDGITGTGATAGGALSIEGSAGQLFSVVNRLGTGSIFSVNDISGFPIIDANANGTLSLAPSFGNVGVGLTGPTNKFQVTGNAYVSGLVTAVSGISASGGVTLAGTLQGTTATFTGLLSTSAGISASGGTFGRFVTIYNIPFGAGGTASYTPTNLLGIGDDNRTNIAIGLGALSSNIPQYSVVPLTIRGVFNTAVGYQALQNLSGVTGSVNSILNTALGYFSLSALKIGSGNLGIGASSLFGLTSGSSNIGIGDSSAQYAFASGTTAADALNNGTYIGSYTRASGTSASGEIVIGYAAVGLGNNTTVIGATAQASATIYGLVNAPSGISASGGTFTSNVQAATYTETSNQIRVTNNARSWFL